MRTCENCKVTLRYDGQRCPLCHHTLPAGGEEDIYPYIPTVRQQHGLLFQIMQFVSVAVAVASVAVNLLLPHTGLWCLFVLCGLACVWLSLGICIRKRKNLLKVVCYQVALLSAFAVLWDLFTHWRGWSVTFVIPGLCLCAMLIVPILNKILGLDVHELLIYLVILALFCAVPALFAATGLAKVLWPTLVCVSGSVISLAALLIFGGSAMHSELQRRLHFK